MSRLISNELRAAVIERAGFRCEYCRLPESAAAFPFEVDHIIALKHGGKMELLNLACSCLRCNRCKGTDFATFLAESMRPIFFFNPRKHRWFDHFETAEGVIYTKTAIGESTLKIFQFNLPVERIMARKSLEMAGLFP